MSSQQRPELTKFESPLNIPQDPKEALGFYSGVVAGLAYLGLRGAKVVVGGEPLRAMSEGRLKQLAVDSAWGAINLLRENQDPRLDEISSSLLRVTDMLQSQPFTKEKDFRDLNS